MSDPQQPQGAPAGAPSPGPSRKPLVVGIAALVVVGLGILWLVLRGNGRMWRRLGDRSEIVELSPGVSVAIPTGAHFQFRSDSDEGLEAVGVTMPPWPGADEAYPVEGPWRSTP